MLWLCGKTDFRRRRQLFPYTFSLLAVGCGGIVVKTVLSDIIIQHGGQGGLVRFVLVSVDVA